MAPFSDFSGELEISIFVYNLLIYKCRLKINVF